MAEAKTENKKRKETASEQPYVSLHDQAYEQIKRQIITLNYEPGSYLNEAMICADLGFGKTPVRRAIDQLRLEGMLQVMPRKGIIVKPVSLQEIYEIADIRAVVEPYCAALAAERASEDDIRQLNANIEETVTRSDARDIEGQMMCDREFHSLLAASARNSVLAEILRNLHDRALRFWFISLTDPIHGERVQSEHRAIVQAIEKRDTKQAEAAMHAHIVSFKENVTQQI